MSTLPDKKEQEIISRSELKELGTRDGNPVLTEKN